ncbi:MAG TPA: PHP domain-containing protein [Vicinamibacterales bacterium]|nr:PHP domain-containing protein [Vicinamibacterales bacterium]
MIDLHLHTTASDGECAPAELVERARRAGLRTIAVTDHDTVAGIEDARRAGEQYGMRVIAGIEITAVASEKDVHMLGYFIDPGNRELLSFLVEQRTARIERVHEMGRRLAALGCPIDVEALLAPFGKAGRAVGRPAIAKALVEAGYVANISEAFERYLGLEAAAFVPRRGASPEEVVGVIHRAGGLAAVAHPGPSARDHLIPPMIEAGLDAIEAYHTDHDEAMVAKYRAMAEQHGLAVCGGSDFHGESRHPHATLGIVTLPPEEFEKFAARAAAR